PVFARACAACHLPNGVSGTDLSTADDWAKEKSAIHERVVVQRSMPPAGHAITDADREAIRAWTEAAQP
ncbi:MAG TPA: cytochrome c, partial [Polyangiaceae bacterium]